MKSEEVKKYPRNESEEFFCERTVKRCINVGKNSKKYTFMIDRKFYKLFHQLVFEGREIEMLYLR